MENFGGSGNAGSAGGTISGDIGANFTGFIAGGAAAIGGVKFSAALFITLGFIVTSNSILNGGSGTGCVSTSP